MYDSFPQAVLIAHVALHDKHANFVRVLGLLAASIVRKGQSSTSAQQLLIQQSKILCDTEPSKEAATSVARASIPFRGYASRSCATCFVYSTKPPFADNVARVYGHPV